MSADPASLKSPVPHLYSRIKNTNILVVKTYARETEFYSWFKDVNCVNCLERLLVLASKPNWSED